MQLLDIFRVKILNRSRNYENQIRRRKVEETLAASEEIARRLAELTAEQESYKKTNAYNS